MPTNRFSHFIPRVLAFTGRGVLEILHELLQASKSVVKGLALALCRVGCKLLQFATDVSSEFQCARDVQAGHG